MNEKVKNKYKISILGDSISTYSGYNPYIYPVYYRGDKLYKNGLTSVNDTWWKQVIDAVDGELCVNNSFSGSTVSGEFYPSACSDTRCSALHEEAAPDLILVYIGTNDRGFELPIKMEEPRSPKGFYGAYRLMLQRIKKNYPLAKIVCATLPMGRLKDGEYIAYDRFMRPDLRYDEAIRAAAAAENCFLADLASFGESYETLDFCHPTKNGHKTLAELWLKAISSIFSENL